VRGVSQVRSIAVCTFRYVMMPPNSQGSDRKVKRTFVHTSSLIITYSCQTLQHDVRLPGQKVPSELDRHSSTSLDASGNHHLTFILGSRRFLMGSVPFACGMPGCPPPCGCHPGSTGTVSFGLPCCDGEGVEDYPCVEQGKLVFIYSRVRFGDSRID
jgi:hypothetical protein